MFGERCPVGMIITPYRVLIYRDQYTSYSDASIELVGDYIGPVFQESNHSEFSSQTEPSAVSSYRGFAFESEVQYWLERIASHIETLDSLPGELRILLQEHVVSALGDGEIRAAGPRWRPTWAHV
ncbi:MAG: hypothetical protein MJE77_33240 [Proteobacteria bacterium]|nr:hypothetical protein [Pseudomonadota bacterium]